MVDPGIHAEMTILVRREKELERLIEKLDKEEIPLWEKRVDLATKKGMHELADEAEERVRTLRKQSSEARLELDSIDMQKSMLRYESKRPRGHEVERAEALLESVRLAGLVDPDRPDFDSLEEESGIQLDFGEDD